MGLFSGIKKIAKKALPIASSFLGGPMLGASVTWGDALMGAGSALWDRRENRNATRSARNYENPAAIRARYEKAGFNPLLAFQGNGASTIDPARTIGANSSLASLTSAALDRASEQKIAKAYIEQENERLAQMNEQLTLKGGTTPSVYEANSTRNGVGSSYNPDANSDVEKTKAPLSPMDDDGAYYENVLGVKMPNDAGDRNTAAGGDLVGEAENITEWVGRGADQITENRIKKDGGFVFRSGGKIYAMEPSKKKARDPVPSSLMWGHSRLGNMYRQQRHY